MSATTTRSSRKDVLLKYKLASRMYDYSKANAEIQQAEVSVATMQMYVTDMKRVMRRHTLAKRKKLAFAAMVTGERLETLAARLATSVTKAQESLGRERTAMRQYQQLSLKDIVAEIDAVFAIFDRVEIKSEQGYGPVLAVTVGPVTLEDVELGEFCIELNCYRGEPRYFVKALQPNWSAYDDRVCHPHISDESLCEGEGSHLIRNAFREGRVSDFFLIVEQIINTYNDGSPYVELRNWKGTACYGCDYVMADSDDHCSCMHCDNVSCEDCISYCGTCDNGMCSRHKEYCRHCESTTCEECLTSCADCGNDVCDDCLHSEERLCDGCFKNAELLRSEQEEVDETED